MTAIANAKNHHQLETDIKQIYDNVCIAFIKLDINTALSYFSDSEEMVKISNGNVLRGKDQLAEYWNRLVSNKEGLQVTMENVEIHTIDDKHVWSTADEYITFDGKTQKAIVSNIFILTSDGWKILLDHTTYLPSE